MIETADDNILPGLLVQRLVPRAEKGEFSGPNAHATLFERLVGAIVTDNDEELEQVLAIVDANEAAGIDPSHNYTDRVAWSVN